MKTQVWSNPLKSLVVRNEYLADSKSSCGSSCISGCMLTQSSVLSENFPIQHHFMKNSAFSNILILYSFNEISQVNFKFHFSTLTLFFEILLSIFNQFSLKSTLNLCILLPSISSKVITSVCSFHFPLKHFLRAHQLHTA